MGYSDGGPLVAHTPIRARYAETDQMGVVHHAVYPVWFEVGRGDLMRDLGLAYRDIEAAGRYLMLAELRVRYRAPARYDDELVLHTRLTRLRSRQLVFAYRLQGPGGHELVTGETVHVPTDHAHRVSALDPGLLSRLAPALGGE